MTASEGDGPKGWEPANQEELWDRGDGRGAATGGEPDGIPGAGDYGGGRGTDYGDGEEGEALLPNGDRASTRAGAPVPERPRIGWGDEGEHYPSADGPPNNAPDDNRPTGGGGA